MNVATAALADSVRLFAAWWWTELTGLIPPRIRRQLGESGRAGRLVIGKDGTVALRDDDRGERPSETVYQSLDDAVGAGEVRRRRRPLQIVLTDGDCFAREVSIPRGARSRVRDVLRIELEQTTPFRPDEIYWGYRLQPAAGGGWIAARQFIAKRSRVDAVLEPLRRVGLPVQAVGVEDGDGAFVSLFTLPERRLARTVRLALRSAVLVLVAAAVLLAGATVALLFHRQSVAMAELEADIAAMRERAVAVRTRIEAMRSASLVTDSLLRRKFDAVPLVTVLEEAARVLPDTAWVTELQFEGGSASLSGEAQSAPELINILEASPVFSQVAFVAPVTRAAGSETESFALQLAVDSAATQDGAGPGAAP